MHPGSVSPCLARWYKRIVTQEQHCKFGFGNGRIINFMASYGGSLSKVTSSLRCIVQWKLTHYWLGKTPCSEGIIGSNATSASINSTIKKAKESLLTHLHIAGEESYMMDIPSRSFGSNLAWFCKNNTDLLNLFNKNSPLPNQTSWTVFSPSNAASINVISVLRMQHFEMGEWIQLKKAGKHVGKLVFFCQTFGSGALAAGFHVPAASSVPHRLRSLCTLGKLWMRKTSFNWHSLWDALSRWYEGCFGIWRKSHKSSRQKNCITTIGTNDGRMEDPLTKKKLPAGIDVS